MSLIRYHNLLMFQTSSAVLEVIGEDESNTAFSTNSATQGMTVTETAEYDAVLAGATDLIFKMKSVSQLPPGTSFTSLTTLDITGCTNIAQVPTSYPTTLQTIRASSTKLSSIPSIYTNIATLDVSNCKRISSVSIPSLQTLIMSHSAVTEVTQLQNLVRLIALNTKVTTIPAAPSLVVVMWSGVSNATLSVDPSNTSIVQILTTGEEQNVSSANGVVTSLML